MSTRVEIRALFEAKQKEMVERLVGERRIVSHPGEKGSVTEESWRELLAAYLPDRYRISKGFVVDVNGNRSEQIDVIVFDRQYSPTLFERKGVCFVPAESVYATFEVRQVINRRNLEYASNKVATVRRLQRTSAQIVHAGGEYSPRTPFPVLGGILATSSQWNPYFGDSFQDAMGQLNKDGRLNCGCALQHGAFRVEYGVENKSGLKISVEPPDLSLVSFLFQFLHALQRMGTVPAMDFEEWLKRLKK